MKRQLRSRSWPHLSAQKTCRLTKTWTLKKMYRRMKVNRTRKASLNSLYRNGDCASQPFAKENSIRAYSDLNTSSSRKRWIGALNRRTLSVSSSTETRCWGVGSRKSSRWSSKPKKSHASSAWCQTASKSCSLTNRTFLRTRSSYAAPSLTVPLSCTNSASTA